MRNAVWGWLFRNRFAGIVYDLQSESEQSISVLEAEARNGELRTTAERSNIEEASLSMVSKTARIALVVAGQGVLFKKIAGLPTQSLDDTVKEAFPFIKHTEFFSQIYRSEHGLFVTIVKRETLTKLLERLAALGIFPSSLTLGPFSIAAVLPLLQGGPSLKSSTYELQYDGKGLKEVARVDRDKQGATAIESGSIKTAALLNLGAILHAISPSPIEFTDASLLENLHTSYRYKLFFYRFRQYAFLSLFAILAINVVLFGQYSSENQLLTERNSAAIALTKRLADLELRYQGRRRFADSLNLTNNTRIAFYGDRLAKGLPEGIQWDELTVYPALRKLDETLPAFEEKKIRIKGTCSDPLILQRWISEIREYPWVSSVEDQKYFFNDERRVGEFEFDLMLSE